MGFVDLLWPRNFCNEGVTFLEMEYDTITQRNNIRRANTCDPALKLLNEEITSDIQTHKQTYGRST